MSSSFPNVITEKPSLFFNRLFFWYVLTLFHRRFQCIWLDDASSPELEKSILFLGNHHSWWDGLIPLLLNERIFHLKGRAMMDEAALRRHPFFRRIGTFSIHRQNPRKALESLHYASEMMNHAETGKKIALWIYPEGKMKSPASNIRSEGGVVRLIRMLNPDKSQIVPFATWMHTMRSDKPELFIKIGKSLSFSKEGHIFKEKHSPEKSRKEPLSAKSSRQVNKEMISDIDAILQRLLDATRRESPCFDHKGYPEGNWRLFSGRLPSGY